MHHPPCPICGEPIQLHHGAHYDFDCPNGCHAHDPDAWITARAEQLARDVETWLEQRHHPTGSA